MTREDIDRIASEYFDDKESEHEMDEVFDLAKKALEKQMQEPKTGHWILGICNNCGYNWGKDAPIASVPNFCPNCGMMADKEDKYAKFNEACKLAKIDCDLH